MALVLKDRVRESSLSSGTGNITLAGAIVGYQTFNSAIPNGSVVYYTIHNLTAPYDNEWEVGYGTFTAPSTLSRDFVYESSNAGSLVNFTSGAQGLDVFITQPAEQAIYQETNGDLKLVNGVITVSIDGTEGNTLANTTYQAFGTINNFIQMNQQNLSGGSDASTDYVATNDTGDDTKNYIDMGIGSSGYSSVDFPLHKANDGYLYVLGDGVNSANLVVGTGNTGNVIVHTGGINTPNIVAVFDGNQDAAFSNNVSITANVSANNANFTTAAYASANVALITAANQLATKEYVDNSTSAGLHIHEPVLVETTGNLNATYAQGGTTFNITQTISPNTVVTSAAHGLSQNDQIWLTTTAGNGLSTNTAYFVFSTPNSTALTLSTNFGGAQYTGISNGTSLTYATRANSGVGATLTNAGANVALTVDGVSLANTNRVMVRLQTNPNENGVYVVSNPGNGSAQWVLTRAADANYFSPQDTNGLGEGDYFYTQSGNLNAGDSHVLTTPGNIIIGYTNLTYTQFSGAVTYTGVSPINVSGQTISLTGTVPATNGGTGANTVAVGDLLYGSATDTWSKLPLGAAYKPLVVNASGTQVEWNALALNQTAAVSGNLAATNGGTGIGAYTQGEMLYANTTTQLDKVTPNQTTTRKFLSQTGTGTTANAPGWNQPDAADITGLGTMATQNANNVSIIGGTLDNVVIGANTAANGTFTNVSATNVSATNGLFTNVSGNGVALTAINASNISSGTIANARTTASDANSASTIVARDANGSFGANIVTATFSGNAAGLSAINASNISSGTIANARTTAASANGASTIVLRDSGGSFDANTVNAVSLIGNAAQVTAINASNISSGTIANARTTASSSNGASTIVLRGASGEFAAGAITGSSFSGNGSAITDINASAITTGTIDNARTTASSANGASTIVARDAGGNFSANTITVTAINATSITNSGLTANRVTYATTGGQLTDSANMVFATQYNTGANPALYSLYGVAVGTGTLSYPSTNTGVGFYSRGGTSMGGFLVQDGNGRLNQYWNAYTDAGIKYIVSGEASARYLMSVNSTTGGLHAWYGAPSGTAGSAITFTQMGQMVSGTGGSIWFSQRGTNSDFYMDTSGNVGIGTSSPNTKLQVITASGSDGVEVATASGASRRRVLMTVDGTAGYIDSYNFAGSAGASLCLNPNGGNVGIGISSPAFKLQVIGTSQLSLSGAGTQQALQLNNSDTTAGTQAVKLGFSSAGVTKASINAAVYGNDYMTFNVGSDTERMRIDSSGNVGIGTSSIAGKFNVASGRSFFGANSETYSIGLGFTQARVNSGQTYYIGATDSTTPDLVFSNSAGTERMRIDSSGNVMVGTTTASGRLSVFAASGQQQAGYFAAATGQFALAINTAGGNNYYITTAGSSDESLRFINSGGGETMRLTASGNLGIGTSSPSYKLDVNGTGRFKDTLVLETTSAYANLEIGGASGAYIDLKNPASDDYDFRIINDASSTSLITASTTPIIFSTNAAERMRIHASGGVSVGNTTDRGSGALSVASGTYAESTAPFFLNATTVSANYTIPSNFNAVTAGTITINSGVTVTVSTGSSWVIV